MDGIARAFTKFGVAPHGPAKQLWLRNGRASRVLDIELFRLLELGDDMYNAVAAETTTEPDFTT